MPSWSRQKFLGLSLLVLLLAFWLRLTNLYAWPVFYDEANHIRWAQNLSAGTQDYPLWMDGKWLTGLTLAGLRVLGPNALWVGRAGVAILALISCAASIGLGTRLGGRRAGLLAGLLYALLPLAVFHDRQALADPLSAAAGNLALLFCLQLTRRNRAGAFIQEEKIRKITSLACTLRLSLALAASILFKLTGLPYMIILALAPLVLGANRAARLKLTRQVLFGLGLTAGLVGLALWMSFPLGYHDNQLLSQGVGFIGCPPLVCQGDTLEQWRRLQVSGESLLQTVAPYLGWPLLLLTLAAGLSSSDRQRRSALFIALATGAQFLALWLMAKGVLPPRYLVFIAAPMAALAAAGLLNLSRLLAARLHSPITRPLAALSLTAIALIPCINSVRMLTNAEQTWVAPYDQEQYFTGRFASIGFQPVAQALLADVAASPAPPLILINYYLENPKTTDPLTAHYAAHALNAYLDAARRPVQLTTEVSWAQAAHALQNGQAVYVLDEAPPGFIADAYTLTLAQRQNSPQPFRLRVFKPADTSALGALFTEVYAAWLDSPQAYPADYARLADYLAQTSAIIAPYPPTQYSLLNTNLVERHSPARLLDLGQTTPWDPSAALAVLTQTDTLNQPLIAVFFQETALDPGRSVERWLATHLFHVRETWFGPARVVEYVGDTDQPAVSIPMNARLGDSIILETVEVLDSPTRAGQAVRVRLRWRADQPVSQNLKVFVHLAQRDTVIAQHDGQPVGELRPTTSWASGEVITDQVALLLPAEVAPGAYTLRIGLYRPDTQARLIVQLPDGQTTDAVTVGPLTVSPP